MDTQPTTCCPGPTAATLLVLVFLTGCNRPKGEDYQEKIISRLKTIDRNDVQLKQGHNFYWVILRYNDPTTDAEFHVLAKVPPAEGKLAVEFRLNQAPGAAGVFEFQDNQLSGKRLKHGSSNERLEMEAKATEIANAIYLASQ